MKKIVFLFLFSSSFIFAQNKLSFDFDFSQFAYDSVSNYLEIYYSIVKNELHPVSENGGTYVKALLNIKINDLKTDSLLINKTWKISKPLSQDTSQSNQLLIGVLGFQLKKGDYSIFIQASDYNDSLISKNYSEKFRVNPFLSGDIKLSYIELAKNIRKVEEKTKSIFYKNSYEVTPNPSLLYNSNLPVLYFYSEIYNLNSINRELILSRSLINSQGVKVFEKQRRILTKNNSIVDVGMINLVKFPTDVYSLVVTIRDTVTNNGAMTSKKFFYFNPEFIDTTINTLSENEFISSEFGIYSEVELDIFFDQCKYIATSNEIDQYEKLTTLNGKREFLFNFWKKRDPDKSTSRNEFKEEYLKRIEFVEKRFGTLNRQGYKTDRGRVYLMYGQYDQIDRYPNPTNRKPYEIWYYYSIEGGVIFVFADLTGYSDYELIHSTKRDEVKDFDWERRIIQY